MQGLELFRTLWNEMAEIVCRSDTYTAEKKNVMQVYLRTLQLAGWDCSNLEVSRNAEGWLLDLLEDNGVLKLEHLDFVQSRVESQIRTGTGRPDQNANELLSIIIRRRVMKANMEIAEEERGKITSMRRVDVPEDEKPVWDEDEVPGQELGGA